MQRNLISRIMTGSGVAGLVLLNLLMGASLARGAMVYCMCCDGNLNAGQLIVETLPDQNIQVTWIQSLNDNTYGTNAVGWPSGHKFNDLVGSDQATFEFKNAAGTVVLKFKLDYIHTTPTNVFPSGYGTLGVSGGDGRMLIGNAAYLLAYSTSFTENLNKEPFLSSLARYLQNSPAPSDPNYPLWEARDIYTVVVSKDAFGPSGFGTVAIADVHNSPAKAKCYNPRICYDCASGIGDRVWKDSNQNGLQDAGEPAVPNVTVQLLDCMGHILQTTNTDATGHYFFYPLEVGNFAVKFFAPSNYLFTIPNAGDDTLNSDADPITGLTRCYSLGLAESNRTVAAGLILANSAPVANPDSYSVNMETRLLVGAVNGVLANDTDSDSNPLTAILVGNPTHGVLQLNPDGSFTYTPSTNFIGSDSFIYVANDGFTNSNPVTVTITVNAVNHAPVANPDSYSVNMETRLQVGAVNGVLANDTDRDHNPLTAVLAGNPSHGQLQFNADGSFAYTPATNFVGSDSFTYRASDGALLSAATQVTITVNTVNHPPLANPDSYSVNMETPLVVAAGNGLLANDTDRDNDPLTALLVSGPAHGSFQFRADGSITPGQFYSDGTFVYTPATNFFGLDSFTYKASDGSLTSAPVTVSISVAHVNHAPSFTKGPDQRINQNARPRTVPHWATNISPGPSYETNQTVTFIVSTDHPGLFSAPPAIASTGTLTYTPQPGATGRAVVTVYVRDNGGTANGGVDTSASQTFSILINGPPTVRILEPTNGTIYIAPAQFTVLADAIDPDGSVSQVELRQGASLLTSFTNGPYYLVRTNVAAGPYQFSAVAVDYMGMRTTSAPVNVTVLASAPLVAGSITLNAQTGRFEQWVNVSNPTPLTYTAARVFIWNLPATDAVHNPSGYIDGMPYMQVNTTIPSGGRAWIMIEYYVPSRLPSTPSLWGQLLGPTPASSTGEIPQPITSIVQLSNGQFELQFNTTANRFYSVKYSDDLRAWKAAQSCITGTGTTVRWADTGAPYTEPPPATAAGRFYQVLMLP